MSNIDKIKARKHFQKGFETLMKAEEMIYRSHTHGSYDLSQKQITLLEEAETDLKLSIQLNPHIAETYLFLGNLYWVKQEPKKALLEYDKSLSLDNSRDEIISARITLLLELNQIKRAHEDLERLKELESEFYKSSEKEIEAYKASQE